MFSSSTRSLFQIQQGCQCSDLEASEDLKNLIERRNDTLRELQSDSSPCRERSLYADANGKL